MGKGEADVVEYDIFMWYLNEFFIFPQKTREKVARFLEKIFHSWLQLFNQKKKKKKNIHGRYFECVSMYNPLIW